jgi:ketosteroid isomerase-like protein
MSQENVEALRSAYDAVNRRDWDAALQAAHPDFEWTTDPRVPNAGTYRGREEVKRFFEDQTAAFETWAVEPERFFETEEGDRIVAFVKFRMSPKGSSAELEIQTAALWTFRDGKAVSGQGFAERERALEAAGLRE